MLAQSFITIIAFLATFGLTQAGSETQDVAARSVPSPGGNCYFKCPATNNSDQPLQGLSTMTDPYTGQQTTRCKYTTSDCFYYTSTGALQTGPCPQQLKASECTSTAQGNPDSNQYFKRELGTRELSPAERRLKALQYKPVSKKSEKIKQIKRKKAKIN